MRDCALMSHVSRSSRSSSSVALSHRSRNAVVSVSVSSASVRYTPAASKRAMLALTGRAASWSMRRWRGSSSSMRKATGTAPSAGTVHRGDRSCATQPGESGSPTHEVADFVDDLGKRCVDG